jgi:hypothetical protein
LVSNVWGIFIDALGIFTADGWSQVFYTCPTDKFNY